VFDHESEQDSQWATIRMVADKIGCSSETLRNWVRQVERDQGLRLGASSGELAELKELRRDVGSVHGQGRSWAMSSSSTSRM
jgi:transposase